MTVILKNRAVLSILILAAGISLLGSLVAHAYSGAVNWCAWMDGALQNLGTEMIGALVAFILVEVFLGTQREKKSQQQNQLNAISRLRAGKSVEERQAIINEMIAANLLFGADLARIDLSDLKLQWANLSNVNLEKANLSGTDLWNATMSGAVLESCDLSNAKLDNVNLSNSNLKDANLQKSTLAGANLKTVDLRGASLREAELDRAEFNQETLLPDTEILELDRGSNPVYNKTWMPEIDMNRYTNPNHKDYYS